MVSYIVVQLLALAVVVLQVLSFLGLIHQVAVVLPYYPKLDISKYLEKLRALETTASLYPVVFRIRVQLEAVMD